MKRKNEKFPQFDEIIFENRNKTYGAYDLRKRYKSALSLSILGTTALSAILLTIFSFSPKESITPIKATDYIFKMSTQANPSIVPPPVLNPPSALIKSISNLQPKVVTDSSEATSFIPITDIINATITNGIITDSATSVDPGIPDLSPEEKIFVWVEENPEYPGGNNALLKFINENLRYPAEAVNNNIQGRVILKFVVNTNGSIDRIEVLRGIDPLLDNEAIRVVKALPNFKPGKQRGVPVPVWFTLPVLFKIDNN
jgi:periplasmic protein TonB